MPSLSHSLSGDNPRPCPTEQRTRDWLASHLRIMGLWERELVASDGDHALIDIIHRQAAWLDMALGRLERG